jgi:isopentenyl-diphosphate delta-isomerase
MQDYYQQKITIAKCDKNGNILGPIERWEAHEKGILHRAFTVAVFFEGKLLIQHRKHPVFDGVYDATSSSHQIFEKNKLQDTIEATFLCLKREWGIEKKDLAKLPKDLGIIYYKAKDKYSIYTEHEVCNVVVCEIKKLPKVNFEVSYGYSLASKNEISNQNSRLYKNLAPWVKMMIKEGKI